MKDTIGILVMPNFTIFDDVLHTNSYNFDQLRDHDSPKEQFLDSGTTTRDHDGSRVKVLGRYLRRSQGWQVVRTLYRDDVLFHCVVSIDVQSWISSKVTS